MIEECHGREKRACKLPACAVIWFVIALGLLGDLDFEAVGRQVIGTKRCLWDALDRRRQVRKSSLSEARYRFGSRPLRRLFLKLSRPLARTRTRGAFYKGLQRFAIDGQKHRVPDTQDNRKAFGKPSTCRSGERVEAGYPQILTVRLIEVGTHFSVDALIKPCRHGEQASAAYLPLKTPRGALVLWDRGYYGYALIRLASDNERHILGRVASHVVYTPLARLSDGSFLATVYPSQKDRRRGTRGVIVRVIEYTLDDEGRPGHGERHRLVTTLMDDQMDPASELIVLYHERWEIEIDNDEIATHQLNRPVEFRSQKPVGVVQEYYGLLLAHNAIRFLMHDSAVQLDIDPRRLSFIHAVRVIRETVPHMRAAPTQQLPALYQAMLNHIALGVLPERHNRSNPRVVKIKMSNFAKKRPEYARPPQPTRRFAESIRILI